MQNLPITKIQRAVLGWYDRHGRHHLPWRNLAARGTDVPYGVLMAEIMLQQTQVDRVVPKYEAFLDEFPTVQTLASAPTAQVLRFWSGLGYNRRAILLQKAAQAIAQEYESVVPNDAKQLRSLPGIGPYTAGAILAFGYNQPAPVVDTNIERFFELLVFGYNKPSQREIVALAESFVPAQESRAWHSALMDLMSHIRTIASPRQQQAVLLTDLELKPTWPLPELTDAPLVRPKQSSFKDSARYYRGRIVAFLTEQPGHRATLREIEDMLKDHGLPERYTAVALLEKLRQDHLVAFAEPLQADSSVSLP